MPASRRAICRIRLPFYDMSHERLDLNRRNILNLQWATSVQKLFFSDQELPNRNHVRDFDILLNMNGSAENYFQNQPECSTSATIYPARYQLPDAISDRLDSNEERIARAELFALGSILYEITTCHRLFHELDDGANKERKIQRLIRIGSFPEDLWKSPIAPRILVCFCPGFLPEMLSLRKKGIKNYIKKHPYRFGLQALGGVVTIASIAVVPILGAVGFTAVGPVAGSAAAAWQSSIGLVEAGSFFALCQSIAMGGAAVGGIVGAGLGGAGMLAVATSLGELDGEDFDTFELKKRFQEAWIREMRGD
ncbi:hypothetical protein EAE96_005648 [Botrytis aclada]|nr:hypothetical protein EAE96_005648 [Botrytis aclada]